MSKSPDQAEKPTEEKEVSEAQKLIAEFARHPHDAAFKKLMGRKDIVIPYLRLKLPVRLAARCNWEETIYLPTTFLDELFTERRADVLLQVPYGKNKVFLLHLLFEHQRKPDPIMDWRLIQYMVADWQEIERQRKEIYEQQKKKKTKKENRIKIYPLPCIFPIVLYNGKQKWNYPTKLHSIEIPPGMRKYTPQFEFELEDLSQLNEEDLQGYIDFQHLYHSLKIFKHAQLGEIRQSLMSMLDYLRWVYIHVPELANIYLLLAFCVEDRDPKEKQLLRKMIEKEISKGVHMPTFIDELLKEGRKEGRKEGEKGKQIAIARNMLTEKCGVDLIQRVTGLSMNQIKEIQSKMTDEKH